MRFRNWLFAIAIALLSSGCSDSDQQPEMKLTTSPDMFQALAQKRVVFAHQSVGNDVIRGVANLANAANAPIEIMETRAPNSGPGLYHFKVGENGNPKGKIQDFLATMSRPDMSGTDVALMKLCYIDFTDSTDAKTLASDYLAALQELKAAQPGTRFVAVTAPLTTIQTGPKAWIKKLMGKAPAGYAVNARRQEFNEILRAQIPANELFDIAKLESASERFKHEGKQIEALDPTLTYDGGHLNEKGQQLVAASMIDFLARIPASNEHPAGT